MEEGDVGADRDRFDDLIFEAAGKQPELLVHINRSNQVEAESVEALIREFADVFAGEDRNHPARVAPIRRKWITRNGSR